MPPLIPPDLRQFHLPSSSCSSGTSDISLLVCIPQALTFWWPLVLSRPFLVQALTELHLQDNAGVEEIHHMFSLAVDLTLSHLFFMRSGEERVNGLRLAPKKMKHWSIAPSCGQIKTWCFRGLLHKGQECYQRVEAERWICCHFWTILSMRSISPISINKQMLIELLPWTR